MTNVAMFQGGQEQREDPIKAAEDPARPMFAQNAPQMVSGQQQQGGVDMQRTLQMVQMLQKMKEQNANGQQGAGMGGGKGARGPTPTGTGVTPVAGG